ncbi:MAG: hypothetical protein WC212_04055 [Candidatus Delongbacteria bacterium]|jgi:hypothetical protein|nr:hypothetical protein [Candidatus Delongbacteria bacterium]
MIRDNAITVEVHDKNNIQYIFAELPDKYQPVEVTSTDEFDSILTQMGLEAEDGQIFLSEIIFAFKMNYDDIIEAFENYCQNGFVMKNISKSGNIYLMFDKDMIRETEGS